MPNIDKKNTKNTKHEILIKKISNWIKYSVMEPFIEFLKRPNWIIILLFIALYKLGDALAGNMTTPFLLDIGFSKIDIANIVKLFGLLATLGGLFLGGLIVSKLGLLFALVLGGILQMLSNLVFAALAIFSSNYYLLVATISVENVSGGLGTAAFLAYISKLTNIKYTATQFALLTSFMALSRTQLSAPSGWLVEGIHWERYFSFLYVGNLDWVCFFVLTVLLSIPALLIVFRAAK
jgi:PAT family beta-lactamase induction signal transducer AmpG